MGLQPAGVRTSAAMGLIIGFGMHGSTVLVHDLTSSPSLRPSTQAKGLRRAAGVCTAAAPDRRGGP